MSERNADEPEAKRQKLHEDPEMPSQPSLEPFIYEPLDHTTDSIRLIQLYHDPYDDAIIRCTMRNTRLISTRYTCLSYTWQPSHPQHIIEVNGRGLSVGENLYQFLRACRKHKSLAPLDSTSPGTHELWIDAVCIQQSHTIEKNHQVSQMGEVYKNAERVLVWLGSLDQEIQEFFAEFSTLFKQVVVGISHDHPDKPDTNILRRLQRRRFQDLVHKLPDQSFVRRMYESRANFYKNRYWNRMWIAQEILLPGQNKVVFFDGIETHELAMLESCLRDKVTRYSGHGTATLGCQYAIWRESKVEFTRQSPPSLSAWLDYLGACGCENSRDRVFALLALAQFPGHIQVDYEVEVSDFLRLVLEEHMTSSSMEQLLVLGARLIMALGLRKPRLQHSRSVDEGLRSTSTCYAHSVTIRQQSSRLVSPLTWARSELVFVPPSKDEQEVSEAMYRRSTDCIFIAFFDAHDLHVFEYAIEETDSGVSVDYARIYEYLKGVPQLHDRWGGKRYRWLDMASEDVYYFPGPFWKGDTAARPSLESWISPWLDSTTACREGGTNDCDAAAFTPPPRMAPPRRQFSDRLFGENFADTKLFRPAVFPKAGVHMREVRAYNEQSSVCMTPVTSRPCTYVDTLPNEPYDPFNAIKAIRASRPPGSEEAGETDQDPQGALFSGVESDDIYREIRYRWLDMASEDANYFSSPMFGQALGIKVQVGDMDQQQDRYHKRR